MPKPTRRSARAIARHVRNTNMYAQEAWAIALDHPEAEDAALRALARYSDALNMAKRALKGDPKPGRTPWSTAIWGKERSAQRAYSDALQFKPTHRLPSLDYGRTHGSARGDAGY